MKERKKEKTLMHQVKIQFLLSGDGWDGSTSETLWASATGDGFVLDNYPFFARGICFGDLVEANKISDGLYQFVKTSKKSGNSLYRVLFEASRSTPANALLLRLVELGCAYETNEMQDVTLVAVNIPDTVNADEAWDIFEEGSNANVWEVQEGDDRHSNN
jgi:hypothetical protein